MQQEPSKAARGFTLIELLVVVAIISLLVSILLPSLNKAKDLSNAVVCLNQQKQVGLAIIMYAEERSGNFRCYYHESWPSEVRIWPNSLLVEEYIGDQAVLSCPVAEHQPWRTPEANLPLFCYGLVAWDPVNRNSFLNLGETFFNLHTVENASEKFLLADSYNALPITSPNEYYTIANDRDNTVCLRHSDRSNTCFVDGSVRSTDVTYWDSYPVEDWPKLIITPGDE